jgi:hypothetical protein
VERKVSAKQEEGQYIQLSKSLISQKEKMTSIKDVRTRAAHSFFHANNIGTFISTHCIENTAQNNK